jgi:hydroxyacylglutathione hydrolase
MILRRFHDDSLAQTSYLIGCPESGAAAIIDPNRDVQQYIDAAAQAGLTIQLVTETHIHADFVSGARELARRTGATLALSSEGGPDWRYRFAESDGALLLCDGDLLDVGQVRLTVRHTPGHTPEHIAFVVIDLATSDRPVGVFSGDFLFVGDVGRPDLLERAANEAGTMRALAARMFASIAATSDLPDYLQVWPGHGAGSACGKALGDMPSTTLGYERRVNWAFQIHDDGVFVRTILEDQPEIPRYFARMKAVNRDGPPPAPDTSELPQVDASAIRSALRAGNPVIDVRSTASFAEGHIPGTLNLPNGTSFTTWAGSLLPEDRDILVLSDDAGRLAAVRRKLSLVGLDRVVGWGTQAAREEWARDIGPLERTQRIDVNALATQNSRAIIDVRGTSEWRSGHIPGAAHLYLGDLERLTADVPHDTPIAVHCQGGTRSAIAASLLQSRGFTNVANVVGGVKAWRAAGKALVREDAPSGSPPA